MFGFSLDIPLDTKIPRINGWEMITHSLKIWSVSRAEDSYFSSFTCLQPNRYAKKNNRNANSPNLSSRAN